jgi:hypothetical protein
VGNSGNNTVGEYDATTGATINASFITGLTGLPFGLALDGKNHLFVTNSGQNTVGEYDATTGATIDAAFINGQGLATPIALALDGNNHLFVSNANSNTVGEYDATTGATINAAFINGQGMNTPYGLVFTTVPEPSSLILMGFATAAVTVVIRRRGRLNFPAKNEVGPV